MGTTTPLQRFLQSLCDNSCWNYAVFWKLQQQSQMLLMWEDGYFETLKSQSQDSMENMFAETSFVGLEEISSCNTYHGTYGGDAVELAAVYMSTFQYALGDGVIGDVAYTGNCRWVFADSKSLGEFNTASFPEHADEWLFQFAAGVKTILLVPVIPHGVLQLGSLENLPEDAQMANYIKNEFLAHQDFKGSDAFATNQQYSSQSPSSLMKSLDEFPSFMVNGKISDDSTTIDYVNWSNQIPLTKSLVTPPYDNWYSSHLRDQMGAIELLEPLHQSKNLVNSEVIESSKSTMGVLGGYVDGPLRSEILMQQPLVSDVGSFLSFPKECELHKALGSAFMGKTDDDIYTSSSQICCKDLVDSSSMSANGMPFCNENVKKLMGSVVGSEHLGDNSSIQTSGESFASLAKRKNIDEKSVFEGESSLFSNHVSPEILSRVKSHNDSSSPVGISYEGVLDEFREEEQKSRYDVLHQSKGVKPSVARKGRVKPGAKQKTRPRDRQLIQDRLKDLRELVPDGAKCSIDGLLDRTVKHMQFLESVGDHAIKLKQCVQPEGVGMGPKTNRTPEVKGSQNGASWAFELGGDLKVCPILVEDLQYPGHMIIEMICDESLRFLEIAEVIHGLELTILNGVMEKRSENTWARYIVEAPRGFHRLDIFWPLMKLLQQQQQQHCPISSKI